MLKKSRIAVLVLIFFFVMSAYTFEMMQYQIVQGDTYKEKNSKSTTGKMEIIAPRGDILDRYGRVLATSTTGYSVVIQQAYFPSSKQKDEQDTELLELAKILSDAGETWEDQLPITPTAPYTYNGTEAKVKELIKYLNERKSKKDPEIPDTISAPEAMKKLKQIFSTEGYTEAQQRTLIGIRYTMVKTYYSSTNVYTFASDISVDTVTKIEERSASLPGAIIRQVPLRSYPDGTIAPHIIGITGRISESELKANKDKGYTAEDDYGKFGVEKTMEDYLRGKNGEQIVEQNKNGEVTKSVIDTAPEPGGNVILTIDKDMQVSLQNYLPVIVDQIKSEAVLYNRPGAKAKGAAAVVLNVKTGEVLAMANYPSFDLNQYYDNYSGYSKDTLTPLFNRCIQGVYRPGSTFKPLVAVSGLSNGLITENNYYDLDSIYILGSGPTAWTGHDDEGLARNHINVVSAISVSSNIFFFQLGTRLGITKLGATANAFGIGKKTGIELPYESAGTMSSVELKKEREGLPWYEADTAQAAIGQLDTYLTPLQLANYISTLVKNGKENQVHVVRQVNSYDNSKVLVDNTTPKVISDAKISEHVTEVVKKGMLAVTETGTAQSIFSTFKMSVGGKTGTAQITKTAYNGVFVCFAPYDDPEIAVATIVEYGHNGYQTAPAAKLAIQDYFGLDESGNPISSTISSTTSGTLVK